MGRAQLILTASLSDVSRFFMHYSGIDWGDDSPQLDFPQRFYTGPVSASALFRLGERTRRENTLFIVYIFMGG